MDDLIKVRRGALGSKSEMEKLRDGELGYLTDKKALYIGTGDTNVRLCGEGDVGRIAALEAEILRLNGLITEINNRLGATETPSA